MMGWVPNYSLGVQPQTEDGTDAALLRAPALETSSMEQGAQREYFEQGAAMARAAPCNTDKENQGFGIDPQYGVSS
jgi:hypothetical protein